MRFRRVEGEALADHSYLVERDECYFLHEYTSGMGYSFGEANNLISNLKKKPSQRGKPGYHYKARAVGQCGALLGGAINPNWLRTATLVPVPPSRAQDDPEYDDRMLRVCKAIPSEAPLDVRELVRQKRTIRAAHESANNRPSVQELVDNYRIEEAIASPAPTAIAIVDDVLTAGAHYRAVHQVLSARFPEAPIVGMFIARRVFPTADRFEDSFSDD